MHSLNPAKRKIKSKEKTKIIADLRQNYKLTLLLEIANLPRSIFYYHLNRLSKPDKYEQIRTQYKKFMRVVKEDMAIEESL